MTSQRSEFPAEGRFSSVNGIDLYYEIHGVGPPLVLLHNFFGSTETWAPLIPEFSRHYQLIVLDMRGHGRSTNPTGEFTHRLYSHDVFELLNQLGVNTFKAIGHSSGAMTLLHMGTQQADRVEAMVLSGGTPYYSDEHRAIARILDVGGSDDPSYVHARSCYDGQLTDENGQPLTNGAVTMKFAFYDALSGGTKKWPTGASEDHVVNV